MSVSETAPFNKTLQKGEHSPEFHIHERCGTELWRQKEELINTGNPFLIESVHPNLISGKKK